MNSNVHKKENSIPFYIPGEYKDIILDILEKGIKRVKVDMTTRRNLESWFLVEREFFNSEV